MLDPVCTAISVRDRYSLVMHDMFDRHVHHFTAQGFHVIAFRDSDPLNLFVFGGPVEKLLRRFAALVVVESVTLRVRARV